MAMKNLLLSGGIYHPFAETSAAVAAHLDTLGIASEILPVREGLARLATGQFDLLTINALAFSMTQADKYAPLRAKWAYIPGESDKAAIRDHLSSGRALLGLHTAAICFDGWDEWPVMLGAGWTWGRSFHPAPGYVDVSGAEAFTVWDELYCDLALDADTEVMASARSPEVALPQPVLMRKGKAAYLTLGHDMTACCNPGYRLLLDRAVQASLGISGGNA